MHIMCKFFHWSELQSGGSTGESRLFYHGVQGDRAQPVIHPTDEIWNKINNEYIYKKL